MSLHELMNLVTGSPGWCATCRPDAKKFEPGFCNGK